MCNKPRLQRKQASKRASKCAIERTKLSSHSALACAHRGLDRPIDLREPTVFELVYPAHCCRFCCCCCTSSHNNSLSERVFHCTMKVARGTDDNAHDNYTTSTRSSSKPHQQRKTNCALAHKCATDSARLVEADLETATTTTITHKSSHTSAPHAFICTQNAILAASMQPD